MEQQPRIQRLSDDAIARIRSTVSLTSLAGAVQGLLMNSFDANATTINIYINITKNSMIIEDDGDGIIPADMAFVGNRYSTSKLTHASASTFGSRGEFLASLATSSLLTMYSRSCHYRSTHAVKFHYGSRLVCGQIENDHLMLPKSGAKVIVDRLFGNFPVRMVGREDMAATEIAREWKEIGRKVVEVLLLYVESGNRFKVVVRDERGTRKAVFEVGGGDEQDEDRRIGKVMEQAGFGKIVWECVKATWSGITVKGVVGLVPVADGERQFIFLNGSPISKHGNSILYSKINGLFAASSFGMIDENTAPEDGKRLVVRKGVERHPSFVIYVQTSGSQNTVHAEDLDMDSGNTILLDITGLIEAVVDEFLRVGGWKRKVTPRRKADEDIDMSGQESTKRRPMRRADLSLDLAVSSKMRSSNGAEARRVVPESAERLQGPAPRTREREQSTPPDDPSVLRYLDPGTNKYILLDARTGNEIRASKPQEMPKRLTLLPKDRQPPISESGRAWASEVIAAAKMKNPVYRNPGAEIPRNSMVTEDVIKGHVNTARLSKSSLQTARVIAQVDDKYILLSFQSPELLVIVDQHAADERVRVEKLWKEYDNQPKPLMKQVSFSIAADEANIMTLYVDEMREWGFEFEIAPIKGADGGARVEVIGAQALVADRCVAEPLVVVRLVRAWIAELKDGKRSIRFPKGKGDWIKRMVGATRGLSDVISSRACRSAIMFNDSLTLDECKELIGRLAECDFPFQCAHGRPSMVPVVDLADGGVEQRFDGDRCGDLCS
ncbi:DNA mismatch repair protein [Arthrobotrys megalospora]